MSEKKQQEAKKGKPSSAGRRKDSINRYWAARAPRNKERQLRKAIRRAIKLSEHKIAQNVAKSNLSSGEKIEDGLKRLHSVSHGISRDQMERWTAARERRAGACKHRKTAKRAARDEARKLMDEAAREATEKYMGN